MSATSNCNCPCPDSPITEIPGSPGENGEPGADGSNGVNAYTLTTTSVITLPAAAGPVTSPAIQTFANTSWMAVGQVLIITDPNHTDWGTFRVLTLPSSTSATLTWLDYPGDAIGTTPLAIGSQVSPSGLIPVFTPPADLTDNTTGTPGASLAAGVGVSTLVFFISATSIANGDLMSDYVPGYRFKLLSFDARCATPVTTGAKTATLNLEINSVNVTGGSLVLAGTYAQGAAQAGTAITAANTGTVGQAFSIEAATVTAFIEGAFWLFIKIQNLDSADAVASLNTSITAINATL